MKKSILLSLFTFLTIISLNAQNAYDRLITGNRLPAAGQSATGVATGDRYRFIDDAAAVPLQESETVTRSYLYALSSPVSVTENGQPMYLGTDIRGSVRTVTDRYGNVTARADYDAFGAPVTPDAVMQTGLGYAGKPFDFTTGLYDYGFRDYSPATGRFTTTDPIRYGRNWYAYVSNDPVNYVDLWGLKDVIAEDLVMLSNGRIRDKTSGIKDRTVMDIYRNSNDNGNNGTFYRSTLEISVGGVVISSVPVQSTADSSLLNTDAAHMGGTIPLGSYTGTLLNKSGSYLDAISITGNGVVTNDAVLYHPNVKTALGETQPYLESGKPSSLACQISTLENFNETMSTLHALGFSGGSGKNGEAWLTGDTITINIQKEY